MRSNRSRSRPSGRVLKLSQRFLWYEGAMHGDGRWMLRPNNTDRTGRNLERAGPCVPTRFEVFKTAAVEEAHMVFGDWITQVVRLPTHATSVEFEVTVGPVLIADGKGKEVVTRFATDIASGSEFTTDSNGLEMVGRVRDHRSYYNMTLTEPIASNYYPINSALTVADDRLVATLTPDRAVGGTSLASGELELLLH